MKTIRVVLLFACLVSLVGCQDDGTFDVAVAFSDETPDGEYWAYVKIFQQDSINRKKRIVTVPPTLFGAGDVAGENILEIPKVPSGDNYQLTLELKTVNTLMGPSAYFGKSRPFSVASDVHEDLLVTLTKLEDAVTVALTDHNGELMPMSDRSTTNTLNTVSEIGTETATSNSVDTATTTTSDIDTTVHTDATPVNVYYLKSDTARILMTIKEKWMPEKLKDYRVEISHDISFVESVRQFNLVELVKSGNTFAVDDWQFMALVEHPALFVRVVDNVYGLVFLVETPFVVDKETPAADADSVSLLEYVNADFSIDLLIDGYDLTDTVDVYCDVPDECEGCEDCTDCNHHCGEKVECDAEYQESDSVFEIDCTVPENISHCVCALTVASMDIAGNGSTDALGYIQVDNVLPTVVTAPIVSPQQKAKVGDEFTIDFTVSESLLALVVTIGSQSLTGDFVSNCISDTGLCQFTYTVNSSNEGDGDKTIAIEMTDMAGNQYTGTFNNLVTYDFTPPVASDVPIVSKRIVAADDEFTIDFTVSESLSALVVTVGSQSLTGDFASNCISETRLCQFTHTVDSSKANDGTQTISIEMTDMAGNVYTATFDHLVTYDFTPPVVSDVPIVSERMVAAGDEFTIDFTVSESLLALVVTIGSQSLTGDFTSNCISGTRLCQFTHTVDSSNEGDGDKTIAIEMTDMAGNQYTGTFENLVTYDFIPPVVSDIPIVSEHIVAANDEFSIDFTVSEPLSALVVKVGSLAVMGDFASNCNSETGLCQFSHTVDRSDESAGPQTISIEMADMVGNQYIGTFENLVTYDFTPTVVSGVPVVSERIVAAGDNFTIDFTVSEQLSALVVKVGSLALTGDFASKCSTETRLCHFSHTVDSGNESEGAQTIAIEMTDMAGNEYTATFDTLVTYDFTPAEVSGVPVVSRGNVADGASFTIAFNVSEPLSAITAHIGDQDLAGGCNATQSCIFSHTVNASTDMEGPQTITIVMTNLTGNQDTEAFENLVTFDFTPPEVEATPVVSPEFVADGDSFTIDFAVSELLSGLVVNIGALAFSVDISSDCNSETGLCQFSHTVDSGAETAGAKTISIEMTDLAGNSRTVVYENGVTYDFTG